MDRYLLLGRWNTEQKALMTVCPQVPWYNMGQLDRMVTCDECEETMVINAHRICVTMQYNMPFSKNGFVLLGNSHLSCVKNLKTEKCEK